jgi:hypothetical protein
MISILEKAQPIWTPGEKTGYHAITFGWLVDSLMRKVDPKKRGVKQFFKEEIGEPNSELIALRKKQLRNVFCRH